MIQCLSETSEIIIIFAIISEQVTHLGHEHYAIIILNVFWVSTTGQNSSWLPALRHFPIMLRCNPLKWLCVNNSENCTMLGISKPHTEIQYQLHWAEASVLYLLWDTPEKYSFSEFIFLTYIFSAGQIENHPRNLNIICEWYPQIFSRNRIKLRITYKNIEV